MIAEYSSNRVGSMLGFVRSAREKEWSTGEILNKRNILIDELHHKHKEDGDKQPRENEKNKYED
ncbi:hypothetical protein LCGC14_0441930 [marine sediment metagenome]|uniref:Uncharacterized protein n=1 Tax=marine sediment metagenome TaxID=412755 RepID=A0A0F9SR41_9ZZZZ